MCIRCADCDDDEWIDVSTCCEVNKADDHRRSITSHLMCAKRSLDEISRHVDELQQTDNTKTVDATTSDSDTAVSRLRFC